MYVLHSSVNKHTLMNVKMSTQQEKEANLFSWLLNFRTGIFQRKLMMAVWATLARFTFPLPLLCPRELQLMLWNSVRRTTICWSKSRESRQATSCRLKRQCCCKAMLPALISSILQLLPLSGEMLPPLIVIERPHRWIIMRMRRMCHADEMFLSCGWNVYFIRMIS